VPKASVIQNSFAAGELSPQLLGRQDLESYALGLRTCRNALVLAQGAWTRRPGFAHKKTTKFGAARKSRLLSFEFDETSAYGLEFGHLYLRFFLDGEVVTKTAQTIEAITQANPGVITITGHGYTNGQRLHVDGDVGGMHQLRLREVEVANKTANTFEIKDIDGNDIDTTGFDAFTSGGTVAEIEEVTTPYEEDDVEALVLAQVEAKAYIFHPDNAIQVLTRTNATTFALGSFSFGDGPYLPPNTTTTTLTPGSALNGEFTTITASDVVGINDGQGFLSTDVNRVIRTQISGTWGASLITGVNSTTSVDVLNLTALGGTSATSTWRLGLWSDTTGFPSVGAFFEDRLWTGGVSVAPQRFDGSRPGLYEDFKPTAADGTVADDNAISFTLASKSRQRLRWLLDDALGLVAGTTGGEWVIRASAEGEALTPANVTARKLTSHGSASIQAVNALRSILFVQRAARKLREFRDTGRDGITSPDVSLLSNHLFVSAVKELSFQQSPQPVLWLVRNDGDLLGFTFDESAGVFAWHQHQMGGTSDAAGTHALVESVLSVSSADGSRDLIYAIVTRRVNGVIRRDVEVQAKVWEDGDVLADSVHLDSALAFTFSPASATVQGLSHLEGETVTILADGAAHPDKTVVNGEITLDAAADKVTVGLPYPSDGLQLPVEAGSADGSAQGKTKRIQRVGFWLFDTLGLKFGTDAGNLTEHFSREWAEANWGEASTLFSGVVRESFDGDYDKLGQVFWRAEGPFPATVLAVMRQVQTEDDT